MRRRLKIFSLSVDQLSFGDAIAEVKRLALAREPSFICFANVHMTIEAYKDPAFLAQLETATSIYADGKPVAAACRLLYGQQQDRIAGMDFMPAILKEEGLKYFLYGSTQEVLTALQEKIVTDYPNASVVGALSPPFRVLTPEEQSAYIDQINHSGANIVMVSLGCPKQEKWMANNTGRINACLLGVGGAFHVTAGVQKRSPRWMQSAGLEWLYRLMQEPGRLFKRYLETNSLFIWLLIRKLIKSKFFLSNTSQYAKMAIVRIELSNGQNRIDPARAIPKKV